ncbi:unnamed protein product [Mycena citricolor]|uniref:Uncharacterized protein n=1 Tax=Mycena citricolor TaxID=2018698 RepID=A0AAD2HHD2_9AGAR|nr:unnamed protein product [Mycena citricolor]
MVKSGLHDSQHHHDIAILTLPRAKGSQWSKIGCWPPSIRMLAFGKPDPLIHRPCCRVRRLVPTPPPARGWTRHISPLRSFMCVLTRTDDPYA